MLELILPSVRARLRPTRCLTGTRCGEKLDAGVYLSYCPSVIAYFGCVKIGGGWKVFWIVGELYLEFDGHILLALVGRAGFWKKLRLSKVPLAFMSLKFADT